MYRRLVGLIVCVAAFCSGSLASGPSKVLGTGLPAGPYPVGFHREWIIDTSRVWEPGEDLDKRKGQVGRPIRIDVWYPAADTRDCRRASVRTYLNAVPPDDHFASANMVLQGWDERSYRAYARNANTTFDEIMDMSTAACIDAGVRTGTHPLIVYAGGWYNRSPDNIALAEHLASHGYVVAAVPHLGTGLWTGDLRSTPLAIEAYVRDVEVALGAMIQHDWVDRTRVAAIGYSTGGVVALLLQGRNQLIDAVVGLDPSYGPDPDLVLQSPSFNMYRSRVPLLTLLSGAGRAAAMDRLRVIEAMPFADRYTANFRRGGHGDFSDDVVIEATLALVRPGEQRSSSEGIAAYREVVPAVQRFLDGVLRGEAAALDALAATSGEILSVSRMAAAVIPTSSEWVALLASEKPSDLVSRADQLARKHPQVPIVIESELNRIGYRLIQEGKAEEAVRVMRFNALTHPASANAYDSLADACSATADRDCVVEAYRNLIRVLETDTSLPPSVKEQMRANAEAKLKELGGGTN